MIARIVGAAIDAVALSRRERERVMHDHKYAYGDVPGLGECKCGAYRVWDRQDNIYKEYEREGER